MAGIFGGGHTVVNRADKIGNIQINTAEYGAVVPEVLGTTRISGNVIYYDDFTAIEHRDEQRVGKGGRRSKVVNIHYTYTVAVILGLCEGPIRGIGRVWRNKDVYTYPASDIELTCFNGAQTSPWTYTAQKHPGKALVYDGLAYMAGVVNLGTSTSLPNFAFEVRGKLLDTGDGVDVNPADYILYILHKVGLEDAQIDGIDAFRNYCAQADILISSPPDTDAQTAQSIVNDIAELTNAYVFWSNDRFKIVPISDEPIGSWKPNKTVQYDLTADDFLPQGKGELVVYQRKDTSQAYNQVTIEFINRANFYERESVSYEDTASIEEIGLRAAPAKRCHYIYTKARAARLAEQLCRQSVYGRNKYTFKLDWAFCRLEPADLVSLTDEALGLDKQVVIVDSVTEEADGTITVTAIGRPPGYYAPAVIDVHETDRPWVDFNEAPPSVSDALFIQPPVDLMQDGNELMLAVNAPKGWGGARIWVSDSGDAYKYIGTLYHQARAGQTVGELSATGTEVEVSLRHGELVSGTAQDAERGNTVCWINGECMSYAKVTLLPNGNYKLSGLVRGQYATTARSHGSGSTFCRLDEAVYRYRYRNEDVGKKIYVKLTSLNVFGAAEEDISSVKAWEYTIGQYYIPDVAGMRLHTRYHDLGRGIKSYDVVATFTPPDISAYDTAEAWYRVSGTEEWKYGGSGSGEIAISGCVLGERYDVRVKVKDIHGHFSQGVTAQILVVMKAEMPNTPRGFSVTFGDKAYFNWLEVVNADVDFYELRLNKAPGDESGMLGRSNNTTFATLLSERKATVFLYAHNPAKGYSAPAELTYNVEPPAAPEWVTAKGVPNGIAVSVPALPPNTRGVNYYVEGEQTFAASTATFIGKEAGVYAVSAAYADVFGEGPRTAETLVTVEAAIDKALLDEAKQSIDRIDTTLAGIDNRITSGAEQVVQTAVKEDGIVGSRIVQMKDTLLQQVDDELNGVRSSITQLSDGINLRVEQVLDKNLTGERIISQINLSPSTIQIQGQYLGIDAKTKFEQGVIANHINAGSVAVTNIKADKLSAISADLGEVTAGTITGVRYQNRTKTAYIDDKEIYGMKIRGGTIDAQTLINAGYVVKNIEVYKMSVAHGELIPIPQGFSESDCVFIYMYEGYGGTSKRFNSTKAAHNDPVGRDVLQELGLYGYFKSNSRGSSRVAYIKNRKITVCSARWDTYGEEDDISVTTGVAECAVLAVRR